MYSRLLIVFSAVFLLTPFQTSVIAAESEIKQPNAYALLIGINKYKHVRDLLGAVNDVHKVKRLLVDSFNFMDDQQHIKVLTNEQATRKAIIESIEKHLLAKADQNSVLVLHYSGHGSQLKDVSGDEADGYDETIVPHDSGREPFPNKDITDDELNVLLGKLTARTPNVTLIFDSCHSGTAIRAAGLARSIARDERTVVEKLSRGSETQVSEDDYSDFRSINSGYVLISGSEADEESLELRKNGQTFGAMTWFLTDYIRQAGADVTYRDVMDIVSARVSAKYPTQHPQLEGTGRDRYVFNMQSVLVKPYILTAAKGLKKVVLNAGQVHGVSKDSVYDIFPPGEKAFSDEKKIIAKVKVLETLTTKSYAEFIEGGKVPPASRAIERQHNYPSPVLKVFLKGLKTSKTLRKIKTALSNFKHISIIQKDHGYDLLLRENLGRILIEAGDPTVIARLAVSKPGVVADAVIQVTQWGKWFNILNIRNLNPKLNVKFNIDSKVSSESLYEGDEFTISIENNSNKQLYVALIDLSSDGQIAVVFPNKGDNDFIAPGESLNKRLQATLPQGFNSIRDVLKIIATTEPTDYRFLKQAPIRNAPSLKNVRGNYKSSVEGKKGATSPFEELIASAAIGTRGQKVDVNEVNMVDPGNWITLERTINVLRRLQH